jgi:hypothetical protein
MEPSVVFQANFKQGSGVAVSYSMIFAAILISATAATWTFTKLKLLRVTPHNTYMQRPRHFAAAVAFFAGVLYNIGKIQLTVRSTPMTLETPRLILRRWSVDDAKAYLNTQKTQKSDRLPVGRRTQVLIIAVK